MLTCNICLAQIPSALQTLAGKWMMSTQAGIYIEEWANNNDTNLTGTGYFLDDIRIKDVMEELKIENINDTIYYIATVKNQNEGKPVYFKLTNQDNYIFTFENKLHNFPKIITYDLTKPGILNAKISGDTEKGYKEVKYHFKRMN